LTASEAILIGKIEFCRWPTAGGISFGEMQMETIKQVMAALYVALGEAAGGPEAMRVANRVLRDAIEDRAIDDPAAVMILESLAHDEDDDEHPVLEADYTELVAYLTAELLQIVAPTKSDQMRVIDELERRWVLHYGIPYVNTEQ
jgi:hypothetical protein